jgi:hypothetical protein
MKLVPVLQDLFSQPDDVAVTEGVDGEEDVEKNGPKKN